MSLIQPTSPPGLTTIQPMSPLARLAAAVLLMKSSPEPHLALPPPSAFSVLHGDIPDSRHHLDVSHVCRVNRNDRYHFLDPLWERPRRELSELANFRYRCLAR